MNKFRSGPLPVLRPAGGPRFGHVQHRALAESHPRRESAIEPPALRHRAQRVERLAIEQPEVRRVRENLHVGEAPNEIVGEPRRRTAPGRQPDRPQLPRVDDIIPSRHACNSNGIIRGGCWRSASIVMMMSALAWSSPAVSAGLMAEVPREQDVPDPRVDAVQVIEDRRRGVAAPVVHEQDRPAGGHRVQGCTQGLIGQREDRFLVVGGNRRAHRRRRSVPGLERKRKREKRFGLADVEGRGLFRHLVRVSVRGARADCLDAPRLSTGPGAPDSLSAKPAAATAKTEPDAARRRKMTKRRLTLGNRVVNR